MGKDDQVRIKPAGWEAFAGGEVFSTAHRNDAFDIAKAFDEVSSSPCCFHTAAGPSVQYGSGPNPWRSRRVPVRRSPGRTSSRLGATRCESPS